MGETRSRERETLYCCFFCMIVLRRSSGLLVAQSTRLSFCRHEAGSEYKWCPLLQGKSVAALLRQRFIRCDRQLCLCWTCLAANNAVQKNESLPTQTGVVLDMEMFCSHPFCSHSLVCVLTISGVWHIRVKCFVQASPFLSLSLCLGASS